MAARRTYPRRMPELAEALAVSSLIAGTLDYAILIRHREERRRDEAMLAEVQSAGHAALLRGQLVGRSGPIRSWTGAGTRFR
jgi:hypothetical protein